MAPGDQSARVIRERDRGLLRAMGAPPRPPPCLVGGVLGIVGLRVNQVKLSYRLEQLRQTRGQLEEVNRQLGVELATLRALARIESKARGERGVASPPPRAGRGAGGDG